MEITRTGQVMACTECNRKCERCCIDPWMRRFPGYQMSIQEAEEIVLRHAAHDYAPFEYLVLTGGEPLLWEHFSEGIRILSNPVLCRNLVLYTNADLHSAISDQDAEHLSVIRVSLYDDNDKSLESLKLRFGDKIQVADKRDHRPLPDRMRGNRFLPANCVCPEITFFAGKVYACPAGAAAAYHLGLSPEECGMAVDLASDWLGKMTFRHRWEGVCSGCAGNLRLYG